MINFLTIVIYLTLSITSFCFAQQETLRPINPDTLRWFGLQQSYPQFSYTWITGNEKDENIYIFRVKLKANGQLPPLKHPDTRYGTVLSGTLYIGFGKSIDNSAMFEISNGEVYCIPANQTHYIKAEDSDVTYQEVGFGPTATTGTAVFK